MNAFVIFALALRVLGVWKILEATGLACTAYNLSMGFDKVSGYDMAAYVNQAVVHLVMGLVLLFLAPSLSRLAYPLRVKGRGEGQA